MHDVPTSYFGTEQYARFKQMGAEIFKLEVQARALGYEDVQLALFRARVALGDQEIYFRGEYRRSIEDQAPSMSGKGDGIE